MNNITYLLGAGASCGLRKNNANISSNDAKSEGISINDALPLVYEIPERLNDVLNFYRTANLEYFNEIVDPLINQCVTFGNIKDELINDLNKLKNESDRFASIDTYAKMLFLSRDVDFQERNDAFQSIKSLIDVFICTQQFMRGVDKRYDLFLASILEGGKGRPIYFPPGIRIITWNYDFQFEMALKNYFGANLSEIRSKFLTNQSINQEIRKGNIDIDDDEYLINRLDNFVLIRLNGVSGAYYGEGFISDHFNLNDFKTDSTEYQHADIFTKTVLTKYYNNKLKRDTFTAIKFAWELIDDAHNKSDVTLRLAEQVIRETDIVVVIGYSFPTFNRQIDKFLLRNLKEKSKIFIQIPSAEYEGIKTKICALAGRDNFDFKLVENLGEFYIPFEFV